MPDETQDSKTPSRRTARLKGEIFQSRRFSPSASGADHETDEALLRALKRLGDDVLAEPIPARVLDALKTTGLDRTNDHQKKK